MRSFIVYVWRGDYHIAVASVTDEKFLKAFQEWIAECGGYRLTIREVKLGPEK